MDARDREQQYWLIFISGSFVVQYSVTSAEEYKICFIQCGGGYTHELLSWGVMITSGWGSTAATWANADTELVGPVSTWGLHPVELKRHSVHSIKHSMSCTM